MLSSAPQQQRLARRTLAVRAVATSEATASLAASLGFDLLDLNEAGLIDLTVDGADEIGPRLARPLRCG